MPNKIVLVMCRETTGSCPVKVRCDIRTTKTRKKCRFILYVYPVLQIDYLDTVIEGVQVSRQELGSGQYRWTVTFLDEGDDFELEDVVSRNHLNTSTGDSAEITTTKVNIGCATQIIIYA